MHTGHEGVLPKCSAGTSMTFEAPALHSQPKEAATPRARERLYKSGWQVWGGRSVLRLAPGTDHVRAGSRVPEHPTLHPKPETMCARIRAQYQYARMRT